MNINPQAPRREAPWMAGIRAARANLLPGLILQGIMLALLLCYYFYPPTTRLLNELAGLKEKWGFGYSAIASIIAGALVPETMRVLVFQKGKILRANFSNLIFIIPFWCVMGLMVDVLYRTQAMVFGAEASLQVVAAKVFFDQFFYTPFISAPLTCWLYDWKSAGYKLGGVGRFFTAVYCRDVIVPVVFANWGVWIPVVSILYSLPTLLQIPLFALALSLWVILYTWISEARTKQPSSETAS